MPRPKKQLPTHGDYYEVKRTVSHNIDGTPKRVSFYSKKSKADAIKQYEQYMIEQEVENKTGVGLINKNICVSEWACKWLDLTKGTVKDNTYSYTYKNCVNNHIIPYFGKAYMADIKPLDVRTFFQIKGKKYSLETLKKIKMCLSSMCESAVENKIMSYNPCNKIKLSSQIKANNKSVYTAEERDLVIKFALTHRFGLEIIMLLRLGLSRSELLGLRWEDIDYENKILYIRHGVTDTQNSETGKMEIVVDIPKTRYRIREIPLPDDIIELLKRRPRDIIVGENKNKYKKKSGKIIQTEFVFYNEFGRICSPRTWSRRHYDVFMQEMVVHYASQEPPICMKPLNPHELRHTCTSLLVNDGKNLYSIAAVLGWGDLKMLRERYAHKDIEKLRKELDL